MPELPEVETVVCDLRPLLVGRTITGVRQSKHKLRRPWKRAWNARATGARVEAVRRRGKWILIDLQKTDPTPQPPPPRGEGEKEDAGRTRNRKPLSIPAPPPPAGEGAGGWGCLPLLRVHLGMTGQFTVVPASASKPDHLHVVFELDNGNELRFRDPRRFGSAEFFPDRAAIEDAMNADLGPEPFGLDADYFRDAVRGTARNLKALLLDQTIVAGVGNIYADEACFRAKLHPGRLGKSLKPDECDRLREAIEFVLQRAIKRRGTSFDANYIGGEHQPTVYGRTGEPCPVCATAIKCARYAGRSSHYCPTCQSKGRGARGQGRGRKKARSKKAARAAPAKSR